ncbi:MAG: T9SS type A sorting domain-containing protein [Salinibacter sp.]|uniref:T9SS type A sorting domain-containing protein n=1 Tax=Salinibacter sp. TaxID=2065818 RepID=UPI002FC31FB1
MIRRFAFLAVFLVPMGALGQVPQNLEATPGNGEVTLTWKAPNIEEGDTLTCYRVYRDTNSFPEDPQTPSELRIAEVPPPDGGAPSFTDSGRSNGTTYFYRVSAETGETGEGTLTCGGSNTDESTLSNQASATPFAPTGLQIEEPDVPVSQPVEAGAAVDVTVQGTNVPSDETVQLQFRQGGESSFTSLTMARDGSEFTESIPGAEVTDRGVAFIVTTRDEGGNEVRAPSNGVASVRVESETLSFTQPGGTAQTAYRIVAYPGQQNDQRLSTLFEALAPYDPTEWRLFAIGPEGLTSEGGYEERNDLGEELETGRALWLIRRSGGTVGPVQGTSLRTDQPFEIPLQEGWNLIGNPFAFDVPRAQLSVENTSATIQDVFGYNGTFTPKGAGDVLEPYRGFLIRLSDGQAGTLLIDPTADVPSSSKSATGPEPAWDINLSAQVDRARDGFNTLGVASEASNGLDPADGREPPPVGEYVSLAFRAPNEDGALWRDIRAGEGSLDTWTAEVRTNVSGMVTVSATGVASVPEGKEVWLVDPALEEVQNLRETPRYQFPASGDEKTRRLRVHVGSPAAVQQALGRADDRPQRIELLPSVPHPVRTHATFRYQVPEPTRVTLEVYDLLGRRVATLMDGRRVETGTHTYNWTPRTGTVSSGTYLLRLQAGGVTRTRRLVIVQ